MINIRKEKFYLEKSKKEINAFQKKINIIALGDNYDKIIKILGMPTFDKKLYGKEYSAPLKARILYYYMKMKNKDLVNEVKDYYFRLELDSSNILIKISSHPKVKLKNNEK